MTSRLGRSTIGALLALGIAVSGVDASTAYVQNSYRASAFSTQAYGWYCTAAVVQNIRNLDYGTSDHSTSGQAALYAYGRGHNRYSYAARGVDPQGVAAMLNAYTPVHSWHWIRATTLQSLLRTTAQRMRATGQAAVLFVGGGSHVWTMNGYTATTDPGTTSAFTVTYVRFSGPYYPRQVARYGWFDLAPNSQRTVAQLGTPIFRYNEHTAFGDYRSTPWNGYYVAVIP